MADAKGKSQFVDGDQCGIAPPAFQTCDIDLAVTGKISELFLGQSGAVAIPLQIVPDKSAHIHTRQSAGYQLYFLTNIVGYGPKASAPKDFGRWRVGNAAIELTDQAPSEDALTAYDEAHFRLYMNLLNAEASKVPSAQICKEFLGVDASQEPERARMRLESHLRRARWFSTGDGFRHLIDREVGPNRAEKSAPAS